MKSGVIPITGQGLPCMSEDAMKKPAAVLITIFIMLAVSCKALDSFAEPDPLMLPMRGFDSFSDYDYEPGGLDKAIEEFNKAIDLNPRNAEAWNGRGVAYRAKGELDRAIEDHSKAIDLNPDFAQAWNNRGIAYRDKGELKKAIEDHSKAIGLDPGFTYALNDRGITYHAMGEFDRAIEDYSEAIDLDHDFIYAMNNRGIAYRAKGELDKAIADYTKAINLNLHFVHALINRGIAYYDKGEFDRAIIDYSIVIMLDPNNTLAWNNRGHAYIKKNILYRAAMDFQQSIEAADRSNNILDIFLLSWELTGDFYDFYPVYDERKFANDIRRLGLLYADTARKSLNYSITRPENVRSTLGSRGVEIMTSLIYQYYAGVDLEASFGSPEKAYDNSEGLRSRGFLEQMGTQAALNLPGVGTAEAERVRYLINDVNNLQNLLSVLNPQREADRYAEAGAAMTEAENELASLDAGLSARIPRYGELRNPKPVGFNQAQQWCGETRVILEYVLWDSTVEFVAPASAGARTTYQDRPSINSYCLVITKDKINAVRLDTDFDYTGKINDLRSKLYRVRNETVFVQTEPAFEAERNELYNALIKPVRQYIPIHIKELVIVPDGSLGQLPFDILRENERSPDLGETYRISLSPSVSVSVLAAKTGEPEKLPLMAFGGAWYSKDRAAADRGQRAVIRGSDGLLTWRDLSGTETEVENLRKLVSMVSSPDDIRVFKGRDVNEASIKNLSVQGKLSDYPILHFACHGYFDDEDAERSGIVLSEVSGLLDTGEDGYLTIPEIVLLDMDSRMVLLSACETGLGTLKRGDGMVGMARAFLVSGVENVGVSLWSISDTATLEFMTRLYGKVLNEGKTFKEAYYLVKNEFRRDSQWNHPYYWAAFTMYE